MSESTKHTEMRARLADPLAALWQCPQSEFLARTDAVIEAASRAMLPVTDSPKHGAWKRPIFYTDTINGKQTCRDDLWAITTEELRALASPVAGWVSVEDERKPELDEQIIVFVRTVKYGEDDDGRPFEDHGSEIFMGEYRKYGDLEPQFDCFISPISDGDWITHWMPLPAPPAPVDTPTQQNQQEQS